MSTSTFSSFLAFPPEIHGLILSVCSTNDRTCLRLSCKYLYNLSDTPKEALSLTYSDNQYLCDSIGKLSSRPASNWYSRYEHRRQCHETSYQAAIKLAELERRPKPRARPKCSTNRWAEHCECFAGKTKLHQRLRAWMPRGLNYCGACRRFTKRKPQHKGRCFHGRPKKRKCKNNLWTYYSHRGGFGGYRTRMWQKWFNDQSMNRLEARLGRRGLHPQENRRVGRYDFRVLPPVDVNTHEMRY